MWVLKDAKILVASTADRLQRNLNTLRSLPGAETLQGTSSNRPCLLCPVLQNAMWNQTAHNFLTLALVSIEKLPKCVSSLECFKILSYPHYEFWWSLKWSRAQWANVLRSSGRIMKVKAQGAWTVYIVRSHVFIGHMDGNTQRLEEGTPDLAALIREWHKEWQRRGKGGLCHLC